MTILDRTIPPERIIESLQRMGPARITASSAWVLASDRSRDAKRSKVEAAGRGKAKLIRLGRRSGVMSCPCGAEGKTLRVQLAGTRSHVWAHCSACDFQMME